MPLPTFLQRSSKKAEAARQPPPGGAAAGDDAWVSEARTRARRRLIGAVVLLAAGVVGFPLLFETQPRPLALDVPIALPQPSGAVRSASPPQPVASAASARAVPAPAHDDAGRGASPTGGPPAAASGSVAASGPASARAALPAVPAASTAAPGPVSVARGADASDAVPASAPATRGADGMRAQALLDGAPAAARAAAASQPAVPDARPGRFVVQVGAYTDAVALKETRTRVEKLGLKTYTQVIESEAGKRTRVRVGPFDDRGEAEAAAARLKAAGLPANILVL